MKIGGRWTSALVATATLAGVVLVQGASPASATQLLNEPFTGTTTNSPSWVDVGSNFTPCLTAGTDTTTSPIPGCGLESPDATGEGVLRLTDTGGSEAGAVLFNQAQPTSGGLQVDFDQAQWGGGAADGIAFFLSDGSVNLTQPGASGGALGYSAGGTTPGVAKGLFGIGFDSWGNFIAKTSSGSGCANPGQDPPPNNPDNMLTVRGPGDGTVGYCLITSVNLDKQTQSLHTASRGNGIPTRIVVDPSSAASPMVTVSMNFGSGLTQVVQFAEPAMPPTFKFGFTAGTGAVTDNHEVWNVNVQTINAVAPKLTLGLAHSGSFTYGGGGTFTATVGADPTGGPEAQPITLGVSLSSGTTVASTPTGSGWDCSATVTGSSQVSCTTSQGISAGVTAPAVTIPVAIAGTATSPATATGTASASDSPTANAADAVILSGTPAGPSAGYWLFAKDGGVFTYGRNTFYGSVPSRGLVAPVVGGAATQDDGGYDLVAGDGGVFAFGNGPFLGSLAGTTLSAPVVGIALTPGGGGYWLAEADGTVVAFGTAPKITTNKIAGLRKPIVGIVPTSTGQGFWLVASDGGVFSYGDAVFKGSAGALPLNKPIVGMVATATGNGYWLVASDGGVFSYGDAVFYGSTGALILDQPVVAIVRSPTGGGYWLIAADGGVFSLGDAIFEGSAATLKLRAPMISGAM